MASCSPAATDSDGVPICRLPAWILLDLVGYIEDDGDHENSTTAEARTSSCQGEGVRISIFVAEPPRLSHFSIHVPARTNNPSLLGMPCILQSVNNLALVDVTFACGYRAETEYYVYRASGRGRRPSLEHLRYISGHLQEVLGVASVGILPSDGDGGFALVALALTPVDGQYGLHVFQDERGTWTSKVHLLEGKQIANIHLANIEKVVVLGSGEIGFVDLWNGILAFNVLQEKLMSRFIPLPKLLPGNHSDNQLGYSARLFRDVIVSTDGDIMCVELEACWRRVSRERPQGSNRHMVYNESPQDVWDNDVLHDSNLMPHHTVDKEDDTEEAKEIYEYLGWRVIVWTRELSSTCWHKKCFFHAKDIVNSPIHTALSCELQLQGGSLHTLTLKDLFVSFPTLSMDGGTLCVMSKAKISDQECRMVMVDMGSYSLKEFSPILTERAYLFKPIICDLFKYLNSDSDGSLIGADDASRLASSPLEPTDESGGIKLIRPSDHYPCAADYSCSSISSWTVPWFCNYQLQPPLQQSLPFSAVGLGSSGVALLILACSTGRAWVWIGAGVQNSVTGVVVVSQIGSEDASWSTSTFCRATQGNVNQWHQQQHPPTVGCPCQQSQPCDGDQNIDENIEILRQHM